MGRSHIAMLAAGLLLATVAPPAVGATPEATQVVAGGLDSPRGVAVGPDGAVYVAEAGTGGEGPCVESEELGEICLGPSGGISVIRDGAPSRVVDGLISAATGAGEAFGASDVVIDDDGTIWFVVGGPALGAAELRDSIPEGAGAALGQLYRTTEDGTPESVSDLAAFESENNPDAEQPGNTEPDSNLNGLGLSDAGVAVADAGANALFLVDGDGTISVAAVFPVVFQPLPPDPTASPDPAASPAMIPMDPVPTSVAVGPDGAYYVGQLTGFPFPPGGASVFRVEPGSEPTVYASGFTNVIDVAFADDGTLYVLEIAHDGLLNAGPDGPPRGGLWRVPAGGGTPELVTNEGIPMPGGMAVAADGTVYISTCAACPPGAGGLVSLQP